VNILIVGGGGREHALAWKLRQSPRVEALFCAPGNAGTAALGTNLPILPNDFSGLADFARKEKIGLTVVGPDDPLGLGIVDEFHKHDLRIFGPTKAAARLESSKVFAKQLMRHAGIPTAMAGIFTDCRKACHFAEQMRYPVVIKADGLAAGKGVVIASDRASAEETLTDMIDRRRFGAAGAQVLIEEFLDGWECSLHVLVAGDQYRLLGAACDHKRLHEENRGPNTGGMGAYSPPVAWDLSLTKQFDEKIMQPLLGAMREEKVRFSGLLFPGLMICQGVPHVLEFNCRFGDPETQVILPRLKGDLLPLLEATIDGEIENVEIEMDERPAVTVVMASAGYPGKIETGKPISGLDQAEQMEDVRIFHAGTCKRDGTIQTSGGRVLSVTALGSSIAAARERAYEAVAKIRFEGCHYRRDIALTAVTAKVAPIDAPLPSSP
jgi:phosphoribosylamine--glycine ligase